LQTNLTCKGAKTRFWRLRQINAAAARAPTVETLFPTEKPMLRAVICQGDPTSHGGRVLEGNQLVTTNGRAVAQRGHMTACPQCKGQFPIVEGLDFHSYAGTGTAVDGMRTACGARLIATQQQMVIDDGGASSSAPPPADAAAASAHAGTYRGAFRAVDATTGQPVAGLPYRIELADGRTVRGVTDDDGHTQQVSSDSPDMVKLYWETEAVHD
jgi:uncharacterized Zn-binding protein involved in type VI secretion